MANEKNIRNTDNENTMKIPPQARNYRRPNVNRPNQQRQQPRPPQQQQPRQYQQNNNPQYRQNYQNYQNYRQNNYSPPPPQQQQQRPAPAPAPRPQKRRKKKHRNPLNRLLKKILITVFTIFVILFLIYSCVALALIKNVDKNDTGDRNRTSNAMSRSYVRSVLIIGSDGRSEDEQGRSDSMILLSFNSRTNEIILTSFMRDCYVNIDGYGMDKLNSAYSYGGAELLMDTIESNFLVEIDDYITVNFISFAGIVDAIGGIDIQVSDEEAQEINNILFSEVNGLMGDEPYADFLDGGGKLHLNGKQALSFARIRYVGNSDFERTSRQRQVFEKIISKALRVNPTALGKIMKNVVPQISTNMSTLGLYLLSLRIPLALRYDMKQLQIPAENTFYPEDVYTYYGDIQSVLNVDFNANYDIIEEEVFGK